MNRSAGLRLVSLAAGALGLLGSATASADDHVDAALYFINNATVNDSGSPCDIDWSIPAGTTKAACFFTLSLAEAHGYSSGDIFSMYGSTSPSSSDYYAIINSSPALGAPDPAVETYFRRITTATGIQRGDILAIGATSSYSGHLAIIVGAPTELTTQILPRYSGTRQWAVPVADSTTSEHGCNAAYPDSRYTGSCTSGMMHPGAGTAWMRVYTDSTTGVLLGYTWSITSSSTSYYSPSTRPYRIGRPFKLPVASDPGPPPPPP